MDGVGEFQHQVQEDENIAQIRQGVPMYPVFAYYVDICTKLKMYRFRNGRDVRRAVSLISSSVSKGICWSVCTADVGYDGVA